MALEVCILGGGCFWCLDAVFRAVEGVVSSTCGYADGIVENPTYEQICTGNTGHAEVVEIAFENSAISFRQLLEIFFTIHDPTTLNRQGADVGTQYRSIIIFENESQKTEANSIIDLLAKNHVWHNRIVTEVKPRGKFYVAEDYHQDYFSKNPAGGYCQMVVRPKVLKFREAFLNLVREK